LDAAPGLSARFTGDTTQGLFDNNSASLKVTDGLQQDYAQASAELAARVVADPQTFAALLPPGLPASGPERDRGFVEGFAGRAFRRPLTEAEVARFTTLFSQGAELVASGDPFRDGVQVTIEALLLSPHFLYRTELGTGPGVTRLSAFEIASKLAYALTNTMPDAALTVAASENRLTTTEEIRVEATRLLASPLGREAVANYHAQLLRMHTYPLLEKDQTLFPLWNEPVRGLLRQETLRYIEEIVYGRQGTLADLLLTPMTYVNQTTAPIYGVTGNFGAELTQVELEPTQRAGILTQLGFLASNAYSTEIDSIHRGVFVHDRVLCTTLPEAAPNITFPKGGGTTNRERIEGHTGDGTCGAGCHSVLINPAGFAFEHYDAIGQYRTTDNGFPVNAKDAFGFDGGEPKPFDGAVEFSRFVSTARSAHDCYAKDWLEFLHGRSTAPSDRALVERVGASSHGAQAPVTELILELVSSEAFLSRNSEGAAP
jgi:hypothetical protein